MKKKYDAVATVGTYKDRETGQDKKRYQNVGSVFEDEQGRLSFKLEALPISREWSGWVSFYDPKQQTTQPAARPAASPPSTPTEEHDEDDILF